MTIEHLTSMRLPVRGRLENNDFVANSIIGRLQQETFAPRTQAYPANFTKKLNQEKAKSEDAKQMAWINATRIPQIGAITTAPAAVIQAV